MRHKDGIEVTVFSLDSGINFEEYRKRGIPGHGATGTKVRYIEAEDGQRFGIKFKLHNDFDFQSSELVQFTVIVDQRQAGMCMYQKRRSCQRGYVLVVDDFFQNIDGKWVRSEACFQLMTIDHQLFHESKEADILASQLGRIEVVVERGRIVELEKPEPWKEDRTAHTSSSEAVIKRRRTDMSIRPVYDSVKDMLDADTQWTTEFEPYVAEDSDDATIYSFVFLYRSRFALQVLGVIPIEVDTAPANHELERASTQNERESGDSGPVEAESPSQGIRKQKQHETMIDLTQEPPARPPPEAVDLTGEEDMPAHASTSAASVQIKQEGAQETPRKRRIGEISGAVDDLTDEEIRLELRKVELQLELRRRERAKASGENTSSDVVNQEHSEA